MSDYEFGVGDFVSFAYGMGSTTGLIVGVEYDPVEDEIFYEVSPSLDGADTVYLDEEDLTLVKGVG